MTETDLQYIKEITENAGAIGFGVSVAEPVAPEAWQEYQDWLQAGYAAGMDYLHNWSEIRRDPRLLLPGARSIISLAFSYAPPRWREHENAPDNGHIACYAYGRDYHDEIRGRLRRAVEQIRARYGGDYRICIDSAPIMERYWAVRSGMAQRASNGAVLLPNHGSLTFLAEILTTLPLLPTSSNTTTTEHPGRHAFKHVTQPDTLPSISPRQRLRRLRCLPPHLPHGCPHPLRTHRQPTLSKLPHHRAPGRLPHPRGTRCDVDRSRSTHHLRLRPLPTHLPAQPRPTTNRNHGLPPFGRHPARHEAHHPRARRRRALAPRPPLRAPSRRPPLPPPQLQPPKK